MAHFAEIGLNNVVERVIVVNDNELLDENGNEVEQKGIDFCKSLFGGTWVQTSYNGTFRDCFAGAGMIYDADQDIFRAPTEEELKVDLANDDEIIVLDNDTANDDEMIVLDSGSTANDDEMIVLDNDTSNDSEAP